MKRRLKPSRYLLLRIYSDLRHKFGHRHWWPGDSQLEVSIGAILTQNTAWTNVERAIQNLKGAGVLSISRLNRIPQGKLAQLIRPAGYFNIKAKRLKNFIHFVVSRYQSSFKQMFAQRSGILRQELLAVSGIGPETADSILLYAGNKPTFVVDSYTRRIFSRHHFFGAKTSYEQIQKFFTQNLPRRTGLFNDYHAQLVQCAKIYCRAIPRCESCPLRFLFHLE